MGEDNQMMNLKNETLKVLANHNKTIADIKWIGCDTFKIDIDEFFRLADIDYDNGFGAAHVAINLVVVGENWWLKRMEYDGSEWWEFEECPAEPEDTYIVRQVVDDKLMWPNLYDFKRRSQL